MPTKSMKKKSASTAVHFYMAEDFREEKDGKISAICLYTDLKVLLQMPSDHPDPTPETPAALRSLCFLFTVTNAPAGASVSIDLQTPSGKQNVVASQPLPANDLASNFIIRTEPCIVTLLGKRTFTVTIDEKKFEFDWYFGRKTIPIATSSFNPPPDLVKPKARSKKSL